MRNYHMAHELAKRGHEIHVMTNASEVELPWRMLMRQEDWDRCDAVYGEGSVKVSWTAPMDVSQRFIPRNNPAVSKLTSLALTAHKDSPFDLIHSFYLEPYGVAGHMVAQTLNLPHVAKTAGSDAGKLWFHSQLEPFYDHVLSSADLFIASGTVARRAVERGIDPQRISAGRGFQLATDVFCPEGERLNLSDVLTLAENSEGHPYGDLCWGSFRGDRPYIGVYGKLGEQKGSFALLNALAQARSDGADIGLVAMAHGHPHIEEKFRRSVEERGLKDHVLQIPYLPHWRVPSFIRSCLAVCALEQDFAITIHNPIVTMEVMSTGGCLIGATEILNKHVHTRQLVSGVNCIAIRDVNNVEELSQALITVAKEPNKAAAIGNQARKYVERVDPGMEFAAQFEGLLERTLKTRPEPPMPGKAPVQVGGKPSLTQMALSLLDSDTRAACLATVTEESETPKWVDAIQLSIQISSASTGEVSETVRKAIEIDSAIRSERDVSTAQTSESSEGSDPLFRAGGDWGLGAGDLLNLYPSLASGVRVLEFDVQVRPFIMAGQATDLPAQPEAGASHLVVLPIGPDHNAVLPIDGQTAGFLQQCDGSEQARTIAAELEISSTAELDDLSGRLMSLLLENALIFRR